MRSFVLKLWLCAGLVTLSVGQTGAQDTIRVHFLYGSKPKAAYRQVEPKWFGGMLGGHVGIEVSNDRILNFLPAGDFHVFGKKNDRHGRYAMHTSAAFYGMFGSDPDSVKRAVVSIPITQAQRDRLDSLARAYLQNTPYDYAFFGMRCGAATYEILGQLDIMPPHSRSATVRKIFYPRKLRRRLFRKAQQQKWTVERREGFAERKWERD
jgi:hypothetical protein